MEKRLAFYSMLFLNCCIKKNHVHILSLKNTIEEKDSLLFVTLPVLSETYLRCNIHEFKDLHQKDSGDYSSFLDLLLYSRAII